MTAPDGAAPGSGPPLSEALAQDWTSALAAGGEARAQWQADGGAWNWLAGSAVAVESAGEWSSLTWRRFDGAVASSLANFVVEVTVSGEAEAAGLSFGHFKDFLASLAPGPQSRRLQLEVDVSNGWWAFRVDGQLQQRAWWDSAVTRANDLLGGQLTFKARRAKSVRFQDLSIHTFESVCGLSVIVTCYRFVQRLRISLHNWCHQSLPLGAYEVLVVNPRSPDGTHEFLAAVTGSYPHVRVRELPAEPRPVTNKAMMINSAFQASRGAWIWLTDADCLFSPRAAELALMTIQDNPAHLYYGQRRYLSASQTSGLLAGRMDGLRDFEALSASAGTRAPENQPWGYTQIVHRSVLQRIPYREQVGHFAHSDSLFIQDCQRHGVTPVQIEGLHCLHLDHPFAWYGTKMFL